MSHAAVANTVTRSRGIYFSGDSQCDRLQLADYDDFKVVLTLAWYQGDYLEASNYLEASHCSEASLNGKRVSVLRL